METLSNLDNKTLNSLITTPLRELVNDMNKYQVMIEETIDLNLVERGEFLIQSGFDDELQEMRNQMNDYEMKIKSNLTKTSGILGISVKLDSNSQYGFFFKVPLKVFIQFYKLKPIIVIIFYYFYRMVKLFQTISHLKYLIVQKVVELVLDRLNWPNLILNTRVYIKITWNIRSLL